MFHVKQPVIGLRTTCRNNGLLLSDIQLAQLEAYVERLLDWNKKINLISRRDEENVWFSHILHSLGILFSIDIPQASRILDLGSGGGLPGIPLAIARPDISVTLLDSIRKKTMATEEIVGAIGLKNVAVRTGRAEELPMWREAGGPYDTVVARGVAGLKDLMQWSKRLVRKREPGVPSGTKPAAPHLLALKGGDLAGELAAARKTGAVTITVIAMKFEGSLELGLEEKKLVLVNFIFS